MTAPTHSRAATSEAPTADDFAALREVEEAWLSSELSRAIKNLAYPVGMGKAPQACHMDAAARFLFDRYAKMIEMAHTARDAALQARVEELTKALTYYADANYNGFNANGEHARRALSMPLDDKGTAA